jgi:pimeloyl-ACP methyl ester carboxylesterase
MSLGELRRSEIVAGGVRSPIIEAGPPGNPEAVLFLHGNPGCGEDWEDLLHAAGTWARALAVDMPGFGRAEKPSGFPYTMAGYIQHLDDLIVALGLQRVHLVLHDLGGLWGLGWASGHPQAVASITLIDTGMVTGYRWHTLARLWRLPVVGEIVQAAASRVAFRLALARGNPRGLPSSFVDRMAGNYDRGTRRAVLRFYRATDLSEIANRYSPALRAMQVPTLVLWGRHDPYFPVRFAERQREVFPSARVVILDGSGHWPLVDDPAGVRAAFVPFLRDSLRGS